jgi:hypothetical protein
MKTIICALMMMALTACGHSGGGSQADMTTPGGSSPNLIPGPTPTPSPGPSPTPTPVQTTLTVFSDSATYTDNSIMPNVPVTVTGYCTLYANHIYCWDDGSHAVVYPNSPGFVQAEFNYFNQEVAFGDLISCGTYCVASRIDGLTQPTSLATLIGSTSVGSVISPAVNNLMMVGTQSQVTCTDNGTSLDCGTFTLTVQ